MRAALVAALVSLLAAAGASAGVPRVGAPTNLSAPNLFPDGCGGSRVWPGADFEPHAAVDPRDPSSIATAWIEGTAVTIGSASTRDGGRTWRQARVPGLHCTGDEAAVGTGDPWLAYGPDGAVYMTAGSITGAQDPAGTARRVKVVASRSTDGGRTWAPPTVVEDDADFNDKMAITADPARPGRAWVVWTKGRGAPDYLSGAVWISETRDGGRSWSEPRTIIETLPEPERYPWGATLRVLPDGALIVATMVWQPAGITEAPTPERGTFDAVAVRSTDGGATWSAPIDIAEVPAGAVTDPDDGKKVRANQGLALEVARDGTAYAAWWERGPSGAGRVVLSASRDGGATWSERRVVGSATRNAFLPTLAVGDDGTVAITYYQLGDDHPGDGVLTTDLWFAHSHDRGASWNEARLTSTFDYRKAQEISGGLFLGDYFGLVPVSDGFVAVPSLSDSYSREGPSDVVSIPVALGGSGPRLRISVRPRSVRVGRRTRFTFRVTAPGRSGGEPSRRPVARALIRFEGRRARTNARGRAAIVATLERVRRYRASAARIGFARGATTVRGLPRRRGR